MTPDLTTSQTIGLASAIVGFCLTVFFTTSYCPNLWTSDTTVPTTERVAGSAQTSNTRSPTLPLCPPLPTTRTSQRTARGPGTPANASQRLLGPHDDAPPTYVASSSEELLQDREEPGPRKATPGPSNAPAPAANNRDILARYSWTHEHPPPLRRTSSTAAACGTELTSPPDGISPSRPRIH